MRVTGYMALLRQVATSAGFLTDLDKLENFDTLHQNEAIEAIGGGGGGSSGGTGQPQHGVRVMSAREAAKVFNQGLAQIATKVALRELVLIETGRAAELDQ